MSLTKILVLSVVCALTAWLMVDCCGGKERFLECVVTEHHYYPAWTETQFSTDKDGNTTFTQIQHPEIYELTADELETGKPLGITTEPYRYNHTTNGTEVTVRIREGRWTGIRWMPTIVD